VGSENEPVSPFFKVTTAKVKSITVTIDFLLVAVILKNEEIY
jgi:hypothetical protein